MGRGIMILFPKQKLQSSRSKAGAVVEIQGCLSVRKALFLTGFQIFDFIKTADNKLFRLNVSEQILILFYSSRI